jgi:hypothetical protein
MKEIIADYDLLDTQVMELRRTVGSASPLVDSAIDLLVEILIQRPFQERRDAHEV